MRRRVLDPTEALSARGVPLSLLRFDPADWPPSTAVQDGAGRVCTSVGPRHAGCRFWAFHTRWAGAHPDVDLPDLPTTPDAALHREWI